MLFKTRLQETLFHLVASITSYIFAAITNFQFTVYVLKAKANIFQVAYSLTYTFIPLDYDGVSSLLHPFTLFRPKMLSASTFSLWETAYEKNPWLDLHRGGSQFSDLSLKHSFCHMITLSFLKTIWRMVRRTFYGNKEYSITCLFHFISHSSVP